MRQLDFHNVWVSLAVIVPIAVVGVFLLRDDPEAKGMLVFALIMGGIALRHYLDRHELEEHGSD